MATKKRTYLVFGSGDRLSVVRESLRAAEEAYYRASIGASAGGPASIPLPSATDQSSPADHLDSLWAEVERLQAEYQEVEKEASS